MQKRLTDFKLYDNLRLVRDEKARGEIVRIMYQSNMADTAETDSEGRMAIGVLYASVLSKISLVFVECGAGSQWPE